MAGFDDDADTLRLDYFLDGFGDLGGEALLDLQAAGEEFDEARDFAEADHLAVRDVGDVHFAEERQQVVLAEAEHFDVFDDDHLVVGDGEEGAFEQGFGVFGIAAGEELQGLADALGRVQETFALRVFAEADEHFLDEVFEAGAGQRAWLFGLFRVWFHRFGKSVVRQIGGSANRPAFPSRGVTRTKKMQLHRSFGAKNAPQDDKYLVLLYFDSPAPAYSKEFIMVSSRRTLSRCAKWKPRCTIS